MSDHAIASFESYMSFYKKFMMLEGGDVVIMKFPGHVSSPALFVLKRVTNSDGHISFEMLDDNDAFNIRLWQFEYESWQALVGIKGGFGIGMIVRRKHDVSELLFVPGLGGVFELTALDCNGNIL